MVIKLVISALVISALVLLSLQEKSEERVRENQHNIPTNRNHPSRKHLSVNHLHRNHLRVNQRPQTSYCALKMITCPPVGDGGRARVTRADRCPESQNRYPVRVTPSNLSPSDPESQSTPMA